MQVRAANLTPSRNWYTIAALGLLACLTYWAAAGFWSPMRATSSANPHVPDVKIENFSARKLDHAGGVLYLIHAAKLEHFGDDGSANAESIRFTASLPGKPRLDAQAPRGMLRNAAEGEELELSGGVAIRSAASEKVPAALVETPDLIMVPGKMIAFANRGVTMTSGSGKVRADRMVLDNDSGKIQLHNAVAILESGRR